MPQYSQVEQMEIDGLLMGMSLALRDFEQQVPPPRVKTLSEGIVVEYENKGISEALVLKAVRLLSLLRASLMLANRGFVQELGILQRAIFETQEDILFLVFGITLGQEQLHDRFLRAFWRKPINELGEPKGHASEVPRKKITAYFIRQASKGTNYVESEGIRIGRFLYSFDSGYVHGSSEKIMDLFHPGKNISGVCLFQTDGLEGTGRAEDYKRHFWNYIYRSVLAYLQVAMAFGLRHHAKQLSGAVRSIEKSGHVGLKEPPKQKRKE